MKKYESIKEISFRPGDTKDVSPYVKNRKKYYIGSSGDMTDSAASTWSSISSVGYGEDETYSREDMEDEELDRILEFRVYRNRQYKLSETLSAIKDHLAESNFNEYDLEQFDDGVEEVNAMGSGNISGMTLPLGMDPDPENPGRQNRIKEQIEWMRRLELFHKKTTQRMK